MLLSQYAGNIWPTLSAPGNKFSWLTWRDCCTYDSSTLRILFWVGRSWPCFCLITVFDSLDQLWKVLVHIALLYAWFLDPRGTTWLSLSEDNFAKRYSHISIFSYLLWNKCRRIYVYKIVFVSLNFCITFYFNWNNQCCSMHSSYIIIVRHRTMFWDNNIVREIICYMLYVMWPFRILA